MERVYPTIPLILVRALPADIERAGALPGFTLVLGAEQGELVLHAAKNGVGDANIDMSFNAAGYFGAGQKIGIVENTLAGLFDTHEAFSYAQQDWDVLGNGYHVTYQIEPPACGSSSDCPSNPPLVGGNICIPLGHGLGQQCVTKHASWVASVVAGTNGGDPWGAAFARFYYPNDGNPEYPTNICHPDTLIPAYDWLASANGVTTINESWTCTEAFDYASGAVLEGLVEDWFARNFNVAISKSAGNQEHLGGENPDDPACPYTLNSTCVVRALRTPS